MSKILLALGAAAIAISAPSVAERDNKGGPKGDRGSPGSKADRGDRGGPAMRKQGGGDRGRDSVRHSSADEDGKGQGSSRAAATRDKRNDNRGRDLVSRADRDDGRLLREARRTDRDNHDGQLRVVSRDFDEDFSQGHGCPPGLDKKNNGCLPPGQAKKFLGARIQSGFADSLIPYQYRSWYRDDDRHFYRAGDGFIYRVSRDNQLVDGIIPLFGGGGYYARGDQWPDSYDFYNVPYQYRNYYADGGDYRYRYGDGAIYRVNSGSGVVDSIVALLAGDLGVGRRLPAGYDAYNVPFAYRDRYADTGENWYRYNDGFIYQVDPKTRLISAVIDAIV